MTPFERRGSVLAEILAACVVLVQCTVAPPHAANPSAAVTPSPSASAPPAPTVGTVKPVTAAELGATWRPGCPVEPEQLRRVYVDYIGFDGQTHRGELMVNEALVADVIAIFEQLSRLDYPIAKIQTVDHYPRPPTTSCRWRTTTPPRSTAEPSGTNRGHRTPTVAPSTSIRLSTLHLRERRYSNRKTRRPIWTAAAPTPDSYTPATLPRRPSPIVAGGGAATGRPHDYQHFERP